jgi:hypothetical protein
VPVQYVYGLEKDEVMTNFLLNPITAISNGTSLRDHMLRAVRRDVDEQSRVWCLYSEFDGFAAAVWLLVMLGVASFVGLIVGLVVGDANLGVTIGTGLLAVSTIVHGVIILWQA